MHARQHRTRQITFAEIGAVETSALEVRPSQVGAAQEGTRQIGSLKVGARERAAHDRMKLGHACAAEDRAVGLHRQKRHELQIRIREVDTTQLGVHEGRLLEPGFRKPASRQVARNRVFRALASLR